MGVMPALACSTEAFAVSIVAMQVSRALFSTMAHTLSDTLLLLREEMDSDPSPGGGLCRAPVFGFFA